MKKTLLVYLFTLCSVTVFSQKHNIVNSSIALKNSNLIDAKKYIDEAYENEKTANSAKMWNYRAKIYLQIALNQSDLDNKAIFKATESHIKCLETDKRGRIIVRKWTSEEDVKNGLLNCADKLFRLGVESYTNKSYDQAITYFESILEIIPYDREKLASYRLTEGDIYFNMSLSARALKDNRAKDYLQKLIDINFNDSRIYIFMSEIFSEENNSDKALEYISLGRSKFPNDQSLLTSEINTYISLNRISELIEKLTEAISLDSTNSRYYYIRALAYQESKDFVNSEKDFISSLTLNPDFFDANYSLGALYGMLANEKIKLANNTSNNRVYKKLKKEADLYFKKAIPSLEKSLIINPNDYDTLYSLEQIYYKTGNYEKSKEMKDRKESLKR